MADPGGGGIASRARFDILRYANVWEDADVLCAALAPRPGSRILSIASAGDNAFALAADGAEVVAADLSPAQIACAELKRAAIRRLPRGEALAFLGLSPAADRGAIHARIEGDLSEPARAWFRARPDAVARGIAHAGRFEGYFRIFRRWVLPLVHGHRAVGRLLEPREPAARESFYAEAWDTARWRLLFRLFFGRAAMGRLGRDPEFFRHVEGPVGPRILARARYALTVLAPHENPYLEYIVTGTFSRAFPRYLEPARYESVRAGLDRVALCEGPIEEAARAHGAEGFDGFNLSDLFEYVGQAEAARIYEALAPSARRGARFAYWNLLVPRRRPASLADRVRALPEVSLDLFRRDRGFFYGAFVVEEAA